MACTAPVIEKQAAAAPDSVLNGIELGALTTLE
jgi:hypothetical protein